MKPSIQTLGQILYSPSQYVIPVFQRNYRWERGQWAKMWESLTEIQEPEKRGNHFMGFLVFVPGLPQPGQHTQFHLIDGQQRLTTTSLLLASLRNVARSVGQIELADEIHQFYLVHPTKKGDQHYRLLPKERDQASYQAIVSAKGSPTGRTADALAYFEERVSELAEQNADGLRSLFDALCQRLEFMCATLEAENAYNIFKSLNSIGVPLGASDLIRNFVFMHVAPDDHDAFDVDYWSPLELKFTKDDGTLDEDQFSRFFRDFLMSNGRYVQPKDTFATFEARYEATDFDPKGLAQSLLANVRHYAVISGQQQDLDERVTEALSGLNALDSSTTYPLLLSLFARRDVGDIDSATMVRCIDMLRGFVLRRFICGESSRGYGQMFVRAIAREPGNVVDALETYLKQRGWPHDALFEQAFAEFPLYLRGRTLEVLTTLERQRGHKEPADLASAQIEHVLPQTLSDAWKADLGDEAANVHAKWLHRPGNLTLSAYNQELWNHPFSVKRTRYAQSNIVLTRELAQNQRWTEREIEARSAALARVARSIWIGPAEAPLESAPEEGERADRFDLRLRFWTALAEQLRAEHADVPDFEPRPVHTIRVPSGVRHIGVELRLNLRHNLVGLDVYFWRNASLPVWRRLNAEPGALNELFGAVWRFGHSDDQTRAWITFEMPVTNIRDEASWTTLFERLGPRLSRLFSKVLPYLRAELDRARA